MSAPDTTPRISVVIVNYRTPDLVSRCIQSLAAERAILPHLDVVIVDGGSDDGSAEILAGMLAAPPYQDWTSLLPLSLNGGFGWANNQALLRLLQQRDPPEFIHLLNPDTEIEPGAVVRLHQRLKADSCCGAVGSLLLDPDGTPSGSAFRFPSIGREFMRGAATPALGGLLGIAPTLVEEADVAPDWVTGASVMFRSSALRQAGLFDDGFFLYFEEVELMWRLRQAGWSIAHEPLSQVRHVGGAATGVRVTKATRRPAYWFNSRRRMFVRTRGATASAMATLAWLAGRAVWKLRDLLHLTRGQPAASPEMIDHFRLSFRTRPADFRASVTRWDDPPGRPPAWMEPAP
ncbi:glycosyltransferase family 2 protein [Sphingomonas sp. KC8]|uniref:glycosyltransferase family 2 protein n=1 Tax=Sphingomonas sp. KC8 TaxID=1030157 RepID=UPI000494EEFF|nr:glycosyltransferase family 2 protein [Sphingomonas sp. KC8]ARS27328.1 family 2 glycosyl transferase [Sphingomonas sp. KC8]